MGALCQINVEALPLALRHTKVYLTATRSYNQPSKLLLQLRSSDGGARMTTARSHLSAPSAGDDLRSNSAIRLRRSNCAQRFFLWNRLQFLCGNDTVAVAMHLAMKMAKFASGSGNSLRFRLRFKKSLAIAVAMLRTTARSHIAPVRTASTFFQTISCMQLHTHTRTHYQRKLACSHQ